MNKLMYYMFVSIFNTHLTWDRSNVLAEFANLSTGCLVGYLTASASDQILHFLTSTPLQREMFHKNSITWKSKLARVKAYFDSIGIKKYNEKNAVKIKNIGISLFFKSLGAMNNWNNSNKQFQWEWQCAGITNQTMYFMIGSVHYLAGNQVKAIQFFMKSALRRKDALLRFLALQQLAKVAMDSNMLLLAVKALKVIHAIAVDEDRNGLFILCYYPLVLHPGQDIETKPKMDPMTHPLYVLQYLQFLESTVRCQNCGQTTPQSGRKMMCCSGCMDTYYCSKKCQCKHWKTEHRTICSKAFSSLYRTLKRRVF